MCICIYICGSVFHLAVRLVFPYWYCNPGSAFVLLLCVFVARCMFPPALRYFSIVLCSLHFTCAYQSRNGGVVSTRPLAVAEVDGLPPTVRNNDNT